VKLIILGILLEMEVRF